MLVYNIYTDAESLKETCLLLALQTRPTGTGLCDAHKTNTQLMQRGSYLKAR